MLRLDDEERELYRAECQFDFDRYHGMVVEVFGPRIRCFLDGSPVLEAEDESISEGKIGFAATHLARFGPVTVRTVADAQTAYVNRLRKEERAILEERERLPAPRLWRTFTH